MSRTLHKSREVWGDPGRRTRAPWVEVSLGDRIAGAGCRQWQERNQGRKTGCTRLKSEA